MDIKLESAEGVPDLRELNILEECKVDLYENFIEFPASGVACRPVKINRGPYTLPRVSLFEIDEVYLNGFRLFEKNNKFFTDISLVSSDIESQNDYFFKKFALGQREDVNEEKLGSPDCDILIVRDGAVLLPSSDEPSNFGSWIYRFIPKLLIAKKNCDVESILTVCYPWMKEIISLIGIQAEVISHNPKLRYRINKPIIPSLPVPNVYFRKEIYFLISELQERQDGEQSLGDKIYVSRRAQSLANPLKRAFENETSLVAALHELGFKEFIPERYSIAQQIAIFDKARVIVGCGGSNMFGTIFARNAELIVDIESSDEWLHAHANLLASTPAKWSMVKGSPLHRGYAPHFNWWLDTDIFLKGLKSLLGG